MTSFLRRTAKRDKRTIEHLSNNPDIADLIQIMQGCGRLQFAQYDIAGRDDWYGTLHMNNTLNATIKIEVGGSREPCKNFTACVVMLADKVRAALQQMEAAK